jgi:2-oxoisovalerate dehydrogenase E1 component
MIASAIATEEDIETAEKEAKKAARQGKAAAWNDYIEPIKAEMAEAIELLQKLEDESGNTVISDMVNQLKTLSEPLRRDYTSALRKAIRIAPDCNSIPAVKNWLSDKNERRHNDYSSLLHAENDRAAIKIQGILPTYDDDAEVVDARIILRDNFDRILAEDGRVLIFGEDSGKIGDVNQGLEGLQEKHGEHRVQDTGIREATILGQGIGLAMRGLRPIAEIQYLDYLLYAQQIISDDLATVRYRSRGGQMAPTIIRTRGHRLEGIWHSGSPLGTIINSMRGVYVLVPRNMTKAAGFYNTMLESDDPALIIECLNGYRLKEKLPNNLSEIRTPLGIPEIIREGSDLTVITYGSNCRIAMEAADELETLGISIEVIDVQTLLPFDLNHHIVGSLKKTNRAIFFDEDVPGGASAFMMQKVLEEQNGYLYLDATPKTLCAKAHRPAYGTDGDYFSKPSADDLVDLVLETIKE